MRFSAGEAITAATTHTRVRVLGVDDLCWESAPAPWPKSRPVLELALEALRIIEDELARAVIARLATTIVDQDEELAAVRSVLSQSLTVSAAQRYKPRPLATVLLNVSRRIGAVPDDAPR
jgi:hypothetical protein